MALPAIILAAGASRRLGQPKQLFILHGETLLARTIRIAHEAAVDPIFVVLGANSAAIEPAVDLTATTVLLNQNWQQGIATSIHAGIQALQSLGPSPEAALLVVCDQPRLTADHLRKLIASHQAATESIAASTYAGVNGIPAIFPATQFKNLLNLSGDSGAKSLLRNPSCPLITIPLDGGEIELDTPADLAYLQEHSQ